MLRHSLDPTARGIDDLGHFQVGCLSLAHWFAPLPSRAPKATACEYGVQVTCDALTAMGFSYEEQRALYGGSRQP